MIKELRLPRATNALCEIQIKLPAGARCLRVRYTGTEIIAIYRA